MSDVIVRDDSCVLRHQNMGDAICRALRNEAEKLGYVDDQLPKIEWRALQFKIAKDPADGSSCLSGDWFNEKGHRIGSLVFNGDGSFFAEYDIVKPHPSDKRWFVEAVTAWGRESLIRTEPRLLAAI